MNILGVSAMAQNFFRISKLQSGMLYIPLTLEKEGMPYEVVLMHDEHVYALPAESHEMEITTKIFHKLLLGEEVD